MYLIFIYRYFSFFDLYHCYHRIVYIRLVLVMRFQIVIYPYLKIFTSIFLLTTIVYQYPN